MCQALSDFNHLSLSSKKNIERRDAASALFILSRAAVRKWMSVTRWCVVITLRWRFKVIWIVVWRRFFNICNHFYLDWKHTVDNWRVGIDVSHINLGENIYSSVLSSSICILSRIGRPTSLILLHFLEKCRGHIQNLRLSLCDSVYSKG